jgi:hypothetical protein
MSNALDMGRVLTGLEVRLRLVQADLRLLGRNAFPPPLTVARLRGQEEAYEAAIREMRGEECAERVASGPLGVRALKRPTNFTK